MSLVRNCATVHIGLAELSVGAQQALPLRAVLLQQTWYCNSAQDMLVANLWPGVLYSERSVRSPADSSAAAPEEVCKT